MRAMPRHATRHRLALDDQDVVSPRQARRRGKARWSGADDHYVRSEHPERLTRSALGVDNDSG
jgi:hypothetical protein